MTFSRLSIVTPVYNDSRVRRAIRSIVEQDVDFEVESLIVDGLSTDPGTLAALNECIDMGAKVIREPDDGIYDAMNKGIERSTGQVVGILNADDRLASTDVLARLGEAIRTSPDPLFYGDLSFVDPQDRPVRVWTARKASRWKWYLGWMPPHPTVYVRRQVFQMYGAFDLTYGTAADYELLFRFMFRHRLPATYLPMQMVVMSTGGESTRLRTIVRSNAGVGRAWSGHSRIAAVCVPLIKPLLKVGQLAGGRMLRASQLVRGRRRDAAPDPSTSTPDTSQHA